MEQVHIIHSRGGRIGEGTDTFPSDLDAIVEAVRRDHRAHLALHFHGGLVSKSAGLEIARRLSQQYGASAFPIFYIWESGFFETIRNNLAELAEEPVFKQLIRKLLEYTLQRLGGQDGTRSITPGTVDPRKVRQAVDSHWSTASRETVPYRDFDPIASRAAARSASNGVDISEIQADLETDAEFAAALATLPDLHAGTRSTLAPPGAREHRSRFSEAIADRVSERPGSRGVIAWFEVALLVRNILVNTLDRYSRGRDHGLYATVVEEIVRESRLGGSGLNEWGKALQWNRMKQDTLDAFGGGADEHAGTALLSRLAAALSAGAELKRITLIGHSTGAIYIANWLAAADKLLPPEVTFDIVFLAPAITYDEFDRTLNKYARRIGYFRMFAMRDALEREDQIWGDDQALESGRDWRRLVYPSSLLYLVSGILESSEGEDGTLTDAPDMPLLGLERYYARIGTYGDDEFPAVARVRAWLAAEPNRTVWSKSEGQPDGLNCLSVDHGGFDEDELTLHSIATLLRGW